MSSPLAFLITLAVILVARSCAPAYSSLTNENADPGVWIPADADKCMYWNQSTKTYERCLVVDAVDHACQWRMEQAMREMERWLPDPEGYRLENGNYQPESYMVMDIPTYQRFKEDMQFFELIKAECWRPAQ